MVVGVLGLGCFGDQILLETCLAHIKFRDCRTGIDMLCHKPLVFQKQVHQPPFVRYGCYLARAAHQTGEFHSFDASFGETTHRHKTPGKMKSWFSLAARRLLHLLRARQGIGDTSPPLDNTPKLGSWDG